MLDGSGACGSHGAVRPERYNIDYNTSHRSGHHNGYYNGYIDAVTLLSHSQMGEVEDAVYGAGGAHDSHGAVRPGGVDRWRLPRQRAARGGSVVDPR